MLEPVKRVSYGNRMRCAWREAGRFEILAGLISTRAD